MKRVFNPPSVRPPFGQYNHGLLVPPGASLLVTSGQLGIRPDDSIPSGCDRPGGIVLRGDQGDPGRSRHELRRRDPHLRLRHEAARIFAAYMAVRDRYTLEPKPVSTLIVVGGFTRPEFLVEVEVTAAKLACNSRAEQPFEHPNSSDRLPGATLGGES